MDIRYRFPLKRSFVLEDCWPLESSGAILEFERDGHEVKFIVVTYLNQPVTLAPRLISPASETEPPTIEMRDPYQTAVVLVVRRFQHFLNIHHSIAIDTDDVEVEFVAQNDDEREQIKVHSFRSSNAQPKSRVGFSMAAQAFFATETSDDPSFATSLLQMAREASLEKRYIEAFRYCFLIFESLYGNGKFKTVQLVDAMLSNHEFEQMIARTLEDFRSDPLHRDSKSKEIIGQFSTARLMIEHLVDRRGYYFHGNIKRKDTWHPDEQDHAQPLSEFCLFLGMAVADSFGAAMFAPGIGRRYYENAKKFEAIMTVLIQFKIIDEHGLTRDDALEMPTPARVPTNSLALNVHVKFLEWAQTEIHGTNLVSAVATNKATGEKLFESNYLAPIPPKSSG